MLPPCARQLAFALAQERTMGSSFRQLLTPSTLSTSSHGVHDESAHATRRPQVPLWQPVVQFLLHRDWLTLPLGEYGEATGQAVHDAARSKLM